VADQPVGLKRTGRKRLVLAGSAVLVLAGAFLLWQILSQPDRPPKPVAAVPMEPDLPLMKEERRPEKPRRKRDSTEPRVRLPPGKPADGPRLARVVIPAIDVRAPLIAIGLNRDRSIQVPADVRETGWWRGGAIPGRKGSAVIVGHVDSQAGPAVFHDLGQLGNGDRVTVVKKSGARVSFVVTGKRRVRKNDFPTDAVYDDTPDATIRLVTCTGEFNRASGHYRHNLIVFGRKI
jgi:LPXTG-site transpeptidase (sortase) family protein